MERIGALIQRLHEQYSSNADKNNLILTAQMLLNELQENNNGSPVTGKKVAVILPSIRKVEISEQEINRQESYSENKYSPPNVEEKIIDEQPSALPVTERPAEKKPRYNLED